jgi:hypothetical protein
LQAGAVTVAAWVSGVRLNPNPGQRFTSPFRG